MTDVPALLFTKDPSDERAVWWGFVDALQPNNAIFGQPIVSVMPGDATLSVPSVNAVQVIKNVVDPVSGATVAKTFPPGTLVQSMLSGGTSGQTYTCSCRIMSAPAGEILTRSFLVAVAPR